MNMTDLKNAFKETYKTDAEASYFAPGRINLIGEHTDYNGGHVFPTAITLGTYATVAKRDDQTFNLISGNFEEAGVISFDLSDLSYQKAHNWANYPKGMIVYLQEQGYTINHGLDIYLKGNIPNGAGLSSSASIELLMGVILEDQFNLDIDRVDLVKTGVMVENKFIGVNSGIMDQFAVGMGKANHAILLDTNTLDYDLVPIDLQDNVIVIMNTNKRRELADSKYNERRSECEAALAILQTKNDIQSLGELDNESFDLQAYLLQNETLLKRARHAVSENQRTMKAREALKDNDLERLVN